MSKHNFTSFDPFFELLDRAGICAAYEAFSNTLSPRLRGLTPDERELLFPIFRDSIPYHLIRIDERAHLGPRQYGFYYVSFHTINSWGPLPPPILVHEVVHVWQYLHLGAAYIPRALAAQWSPEGYDYGGVTGLETAQSLLDFNYEQMASVIEDAFRLGHGYRTRYLRGAADAATLTKFAPFVGALGRRKAI